MPCRSTEHVSCARIRTAHAAKVEWNQAIRRPRVRQRRFVRAATRPDHLYSVTMSGPIDSLRFVHTALCREILDLEAIVGSATTPEQVAKVKERFAFLERFGHSHTRGEEAGLFPDLDAKVPGLSQTYVFDHADERDAFARINVHLEACAKNDAGALRPLAREVSKLADHLTRHIRKENELLIPMVLEHFTIAEQVAMVGRIVSKLTPEEMTLGVPFIVGWLDPDDRVRYVAMLASSVPAPALTQLAARIKARLDDVDWSALAKAVPALTR
jgi:hemerythrin-like domain-containing protein